MQKKYRLKLIRPKSENDIHYTSVYHIYNPFYKTKQFIVAPPSLGIIASYTPEDFEIIIEDEFIENINFDDRVDLVGISINSISAPRGFKIADEFRKRNIKTILGGIHVMLAPKECLNHADTIVIGEAENTWQSVIRDFKNNKLKKVYKNLKRPSLSRALIPRWDLIKNHRYAIAPIMVTRGCPYTCDYCVTKIQLGKKYRKKPIKKIIEEIRYLKKYYKIFWFTDNNLILDRNYAKKLFKALTPLNIKYSFFTDMNVYKDEGLLGLMAQSGCFSIGIGFDSLDPKNLATIGKEKLNLIENYQIAVSTIQMYGIHVIGIFLVGDTLDDDHTFQNLISFVNENRIVFPHIFRKAAYINSGLYKKLQSKNFITKKKEEEMRNKEQFYCYPISQEKLWLLNKFYKNTYKDIYIYSRLFKRIKSFYNFVNIKKNRPFDFKMLSNFFKLIQLGEFRYALFYLRIKLTLKNYKTEWDDDFFIFFRLAMINKLRMQFKLP